MRVVAIVSPHANLTVAHYYNHNTKFFSNFLHLEAILQNKYFYYYFLLRICAAFRLLMVDDKHDCWRSTVPTPSRTF